MRPHPTETLNLSPDPQVIDKVGVIVGLYLNPPESAVLLCVDEKSQIQALDRVQPLLPMRPGQIEPRSHDYVRHGTTSLFAALDVKAGTVIGQCMARHRHQEFIRFLNRINRETPAGLDLHLIVDNYATDSHPDVHKWLARHPRFVMHFTPTSASWLNMVERFFRDITDKRIRRDRKSMPSIRGISTSSVITSGLALRITSRACNGSAATPTHCMSAWRLMISLNNPRTSAVVPYSILRTLSGLTARPPLIA